MKSSSLSYQSNVAEKIRLYEAKSQFQKYKSSIHETERGAGTMRLQECRSLHAIEANDLTFKGLSSRSNMSYGDSKLACDFSKVNRADEYKERKKPIGTRFEEKSRHPLDVDENRNDFVHQKYDEDFVNVDGVFSDRNLLALPLPRHSQADQTTARIMSDQKAEFEPCSVGDEGWYAESYGEAASSSEGKWILAGEATFGRRYFKIDKDHKSSCEKKSTRRNEIVDCIPNLYEELSKQEDVKQDKLKTRKNAVHFSLGKEEYIRNTPSVDDENYPMIRDVIHEVFGLRDPEENNKENSHLFKQHQDRINNNRQKKSLPSYFDSASSEGEDEESYLDDSINGEEDFKQNESPEYEGKCDYQWDNSGDENYDSFDDSVSPRSQDDSESDWKRETSSSTSSSSRDSILSDESIVSTNKYGSVKRSIAADADSDGKAPAQSMKRLRSNEGLAVTPPDQQTRYSDNRSSDNDLKIASEPNGSDSLFYEASPIIGAEAGSSVDDRSFCCTGAQADLPVGGERYSSRSESSGIETQGSSIAFHNSIGRQIQEKSHISFHLPSSKEKIAFSKLFRMPNTPVPFQLHPTQLDDLYEYYCFMREKELVSHPSYCLKEQKKIKHTMRHILVEWIIMIAHHYKLHGESVHLTVNILDRYTERQKGIYRGHYQLLGVTSLLVATKQLEVDIPPVATCLMLCRNLYSRAQLLSLERNLLDILAFDLSVPTAHTFLDYYIILKCEEYSNRVKYSLEEERPNMMQYFSQLLCVSRCFLDFGLAEYHFTQFLPSVAARAAMLLAKETIQTIPYEKWNNLEYGSKKYSNEANLSRESFREESRYADEAGYEDPMEFYQSLRYQRDSRPYKAQYYNVRSSRPGNPRYQGDFLSRSLFVEQDLSEIDDILECYGVLKSLVGDGELENTRRSIGKIVEKYSFE